MGRNSTKENKNIYQKSREKAGLTREAAAEKMVYVSPDRIEKIENRGMIPHPDEVLAMAEHYRNPALCNYYCSHECEIGQAYVPEIRLKDVSQITLEMLANLNRISKEKERMVEILVDGVIHEDEVKDFRHIIETLDHISITIDSLKLWLEHQIADGKLSKSDFE